MTTKRRRSKLELQFEEILKENKAEYDYEVTKLKYIVPESNHVYTVDWTLNSGMLLETKGYLSDHAERNKYVLLKQQYPDLDLRFVFASLTKPCGGMKTTHEQWAIKNGFKYCSVKDVATIKKWIKESNENSSPA
jgi:hypothetical protein